MKGFKPDKNLGKKEQIRQMQEHDQKYLGKAESTGPDRMLMADTLGLMTTPMHQPNMEDELEQKEHDEERK